MKNLWLITCLYFLIPINSYGQNYVDFDWLRPEYGGHSLNKVAWISGDRFIAVGDEGMILLSFDGGATWNIRQIQTQIDMKGIWVKDELTMYVVGSFDNSGSALYKTDDGGDTWAIDFEYTGIGGLRDIYYTNENVGYMIGSIGRVFKTTDGGVNWVDMSNSSISGDLTCVWFISPDTGYVGKTSGFGMYKTTDGGNIWSQNFGYFPSTCYSMHFINDSVGWAGAYGNAIFRTTNGGQLWQQQQNPNLSSPIKAIAFADSLKGIAISTYYVYKTSNGGTTWSSTFTTGNLNAADISSEGVAIIGNITGGIKQSMNYGSSFTEINPEAGTSAYRRIKFITNQIGWVAGDDGKILRTTNSGTDWTLLNNPHYYSFAYDMAAISSSKAVIVNNEGTVITTSNSGSTFTKQTLLAGEWLKAVTFPTSSIGYIAGELGRIYKTTNGGTSYTASQTTGDDEDIIELFFTSATNGYLADEFSRIKRTNNGGSSWQLLNTSGIGAVSQLYFLNDTLGYFVNENGGVSRTLNGQDIEFLGESCIDSPFDIHFANDSTGFIVGSFTNNSCDISYTSDSGMTWNSILLPFAYAGWGVFGFDTSNVFLVGQNQSVLRTGTGDIVTAVEENQKLDDKNSLTTYPNPGKDQINISGVADIHQWQLYNLEGMEILSGSTKSINSSGLAAGFYLLRVLSKAGEFQSTKLTIIE